MGPNMVKPEESYRLCIWVLSIFRVDKNMKQVAIVFENIVFVLGGSTHVRAKTLIRINNHQPLN